MTFEYDGKYRKHPVTVSEKDFYAGKNNCFYKEIAIMEDSKKSKLLEELKKKLEESGNFGEMSVFTAKELDAPMDILRAEIPEFGSDLVSLLGEFFFLPIEDEGRVYFSTVITLMTNVPKETVPDIADAAARLNFYLPCGCFALGDDDKNLIYRFMMPISENEKKPQDTMYMAADTAIGVADRFERYLKPVIKNELTTKEMVDMIRNGK